MCGNESTFYSHYLSAARDLPLRTRRRTPLKRRVASQEARLFSEAQGTGRFLQSGKPRLGIKQCAGRIRQRCLENWAPAENTQLDASQFFLIIALPEYFQSDTSGSARSSDTSLSTP